MSLDVNLAMLCAGLILEAVTGYPRMLFRWIGHPVTWIGALIAWLDRRCNLPSLPERRRRINGVLVLLIILAATVVPALAAQWTLVLASPALIAGLVLAVPCAALFAQRSLFDHVRAVSDALDSGGIEDGQTAVGMIVGRATDELDEAGVARAAIESLAENFSDGVVAPAFWCAVLGLPGIAGYKAVNTADSMIGHMDDRHRAFGWASARLDDLINLPASRLSALWILLAAAILPGYSARRGLRATWRDARRHRSPNAGWPEAAMASALGLRLGGPRRYGDLEVDGTWMGDGRPDAASADIRRALRLYCVACGFQLAAILAAFFVILQSS